MTVGAAAAAVALAPTAAHAKASKACHPRGSHGIASSTRVRVFSVVDPENDAREVFHACALRSGRRVFLGEQFTDRPVSFGAFGVRIAGLTVAFKASLCTTGPTCGSYTRALDLRTGQDLRAEDDQPRLITDMAVTREGTAVWIDRVSETAPARVMRLDRNGPATLEAGPQVEPHSLALARDNRLYWTSDGRPRSDSLGDPPEREAVDDAVAGHRRCFPRGAHATAASTRVRIFELPDESGDEANVYACVLRSGRRVLLSTAVGTFGVVAHPRINGYRLAYDVSNCTSGSSECGSTVHTLDLRSGQQTARGSPNSFVSELELAANGSVAWIESRRPKAVTDPPAHRVLARVGDQVTELDSGPDIRSLALGEGPRVYWANAGAPASKIVVEKSRKLS